MKIEAKIVADEGKRFTAWQFPNGRYGVKDSQRACQTLAAGLDREDAIESVAIANKSGKWHPALVNKSVRDTFAQNVE